MDDEPPFPYEALELLASAVEKEMSEMQDPANYCAYCAAVCFKEFPFCSSCGNPHKYFDIAFATPPPTIH